VDRQRIGNQRVSAIHRPRPPNKYNTFNDSMPTLHVVCESVTDELQRS
jgi:hypothetical protein